MLFHFSIAARDPHRVAQVFAELWDGVVAPFPHVIEGGWAAIAHDDRNTAVEVYPLHTVLFEQEGDADAVGMASGRDDRSATHAAVGTHLNEEQVFAIARREGWPAKYRRRGGVFGVIEIWVEGERMIEVLTDEMVEEYRRTMKAEAWLAHAEA